jgi:hypothetical protein
MLGAIQEILGYASPTIMGDALSRLGDDNLAIGDDDDDLEDIFGAAPAPNVALQKLLAKVRKARQVDPKAVVVGDVEQNRRRVMSLGLTPAVAVAAGARVQIIARTARLFRPEDIILPDATALAFELESAFVGQDSQLAGGAPVALAGYSYLSAHRKLLHWDTAYPGIDVTLNVRNFSAAPADFRGELVGTTAVR